MLRKTVILVTILLISLTTGCSGDISNGRSLSERVMDPGISIEREVEGDAKVFIERVIDGDTVVIKGGQRLRLIGANSPEIDEPGGQEAKEFTANHLYQKYVYVREDINLRDKYGRLLLYIFLDDETFFNKLLIKEGHAVAIPIPPNVAYAHVFAEVEKGVE